MDYIPEHFKLKFNSSANPEAVVQSGQARFTVLTPRMIRIEWRQPGGDFEDRASQAFWFRQQPVPAFNVSEQDGELVIDTGSLLLHYRPGQPFAADTLWIELKDMVVDGKPVVWHYGDADPGNLGGTARTVDGVDGATPLSLGLISRSGWSLVDDSNSLVFNDVGWLEPRGAPAGQLDLYFLGYGHDYYGCLREFNLVSGNVPMIPRYVLGNWWSRYWAYTQEELQNLIYDFEKHEVPLSVCIIDMDWHITDTGNESSGWTGYTWNRELFPDPEGALRFLHEKGLKVALNLHPALGVYPHEAQYEDMCKAMGQDPAEKKPVEFDIPNPRFVEAYFRILHHPEEKRGVDFWWMDWQQGMTTRLSGLDPLWWLNHLHFLDLGRDGKRRSFVFSRWGGLGNHRYPIGFSGDSVVSWASLAFQPYFTATSSNVNYGWWSHDIGGHMGGYEDSELYTRWVQLGVFLPVLRVHSTNNPFHDRRPWGFDANTFAAAGEAMRLRHAFVPYLYSMAWRFHRESIPPIVPMYYEYPEQEDAYACPNQYLYGNQLLVAPFITPKDEQTRLSRAVVWLPEGHWYDYFSGLHYEGGWHAIYGTLDEIPVFAKAGAVVPQAPVSGKFGVPNPDRLLVHVFPGADGSFDLYEDEGNTNDYLSGDYAITPMRHAWDGTRSTLTIGPAEGQAGLLPEERGIEVIFRGFNRPETVEARVNGEPVEVEGVYDPDTHTFSVTGLTVTPRDTLEVTLSGAETLAYLGDYRPAVCSKLLKHIRMESWSKQDMSKHLPELIENPGRLARYLPVLRESQLRAFMEVITGAGIDYTESTGSPRVVVWNNNRDEQVTHQFALARLTHFHRYKDPFPFSGGPLPRFETFTPKTDFDEKDPWVILVNYYGVTTLKFEG